MHGKHAHAPFARLRIVFRTGENVPLGVVQLRMIGAVIVTGPPGFTPEQRVSGHCFRSEDLVMELPGSLKLMKVLGPEINIIKIT